MSKTIQQVKYTDPILENKEVFSRVQVTKLGIQGPPGTLFTLNGGSKIQLNQYGVYEIDLTGLGFITIMVITSGPDISEAMPLYVDFVGENLGGTGQ